MVDMTNTSAALYRVTAGPYKGLVGRKVPAEDVRGEAGREYIAGYHDGIVYEVSPMHLRKMKG